jgi:predicted phosphodiesterase
MKLGLFGDIHGNLPALEAVYETLKGERCNMLVSTGDVVGYGPQPCECIDFMIEKGIPTVCGNHDEYVLLGTIGSVIQPQAKYVIDWTRDVLEYRHRKWLSELPPKLKVAGVEIVHASHVPTPKWYYIKDLASAELNFRHQASEVSFSGHTHIPTISTFLEGYPTKIKKIKSGRLFGGSKYMVGVGSVGQPRDRNNKACCLTYDTKTKEIKVFRVSYDWKSIVKLMKEYEFPLELQTRIKKGL